MYQAQAQEVGSGSSTAARYNYLAASGSGRAQRAAAASGCGERLRRFSAALDKVRGGSPSARSISALAYRDLLGHRM